MILAVTLSKVQLTHAGACTIQKVRKDSGMGSSWITDNDNGERDEVDSRVEDRQLLHEKMSRTDRDPRDNTVTVPPERGSSTTSRFLTDTRMSCYSTAKGENDIWKSRFSYYLSVNTSREKSRPKIRRITGSATRGRKFAQGPLDRSLQMWDVTCTGDTMNYRTREWGLEI